MGKRLLNDAAPEQPPDSGPPRPADAGPGGGAVTRPEAAGSASEPAFAAVQPTHDRPRGAAGTAGCEHGRVNTPVKRLKVCLNGGRSREDHPAVPLEPVELAASTAATVDAGAEAVHLHPRGADGGESLLAAGIAAAVTAVRQACPGTPVGVSTGLWITGGDPAARQSAVAAWAALPAAARPPATWPAPMARTARCAASCTARSAPPGNRPDRSRPPTARGRGPSFTAAVPQTVPAEPPRHAPGGRPFTLTLFPRPIQPPRLPGPRIRLAASTARQMRTPGPSSSVARYAPMKNKTDDRPTGARTAATCALRADQAE
jgi:hypothetical protein